MNSHVIRDYTADLHLATSSEATIIARLKIVMRLAAWLDPVPLIEATPATLAGFQRQFVGLADASINIYVRNIQWFYRWALSTDLITVDPSTRMRKPRIRPGKPHPTSLDDLRAIFACTSGQLRIAYVLAAFAGLRRGEICRLRRSDLELSQRCPVAHVEGKGNKQRTVPLVEPVVSELYSYGLPRSGWIITWRGQRYPYDYLSNHSAQHLRGIGIATTLHSMRHTYATTTYRTTRDVLMLKVLLGHESVRTTEVYAEPDMSTAYERLAGVADTAASLLGPQRLRLVR